MESESSLYLPTGSRVRTRPSDEEEVGRLRLSDHERMGGVKSRHG